SVPFANTNPEPVSPVIVPPIVYVVPFPPPPPPPPPLVEGTPLHAASMNATPARRANVVFLMGIISVLFFMFRSGSANPWGILPSWQDSPSDHQSHFHPKLP